MIDTRIEGLQLKRATKDDIPMILYFVEQLAKYEKLEHEVTATPQDMEDALFEQRAAEVFFICFEAKMIGFVLITRNFSTFVGKTGMYLEDIFIEEPFRGRGFGAEIFYQLAELAQTRGYGRIDWACLDWNDPAIQFYLKMGAEALTEWTTYRLNERAMQGLSNK